MRGDEYISREGRVRGKGTRLLKETQLVAWSHVTSLERLYESHAFLTSVTWLLQEAPGEIRTFIGPVRWNQVPKTAVAAQSSPPRSCLTSFPLL